MDISSAPWVSKKEQLLLIFKTLFIITGILHMKFFKGQSKIQVKRNRLDFLIENDFYLLSVTREV